MNDAPVSIRSQRSLDGVVKFRVFLASPAARGAAFLLAVAGLAAGAGTGPALAQAVVTAVNGDPITSFDVAEYEKILRLEHKPASSADALEAVVADRLRYDEARHWGVDASDSDLSAALQRTAASLKTDVAAYTQASAKAKIDLETIRSHLRASAAWDNLVRARNKGVGATEEEINAAIAKGSTDKVTNYRLQQIVFVVPVNPSPAVLQARLDAAKALRNRFDGCGNGLQLARQLADVAVKEPMSRTSDSFSPALRKVLAETQKGMLTVPDRTTNGIEMIAVCDKNDGDTNTLHDQVQKDIITQKLVGVSAEMYKDLRKTAVISKN
jgi:peptidyl-prolyl cis-trans isomerase SurA